MRGGCYGMWVAGVSMTRIATSVQLHSFCTLRSTVHVGDNVHTGMQSKLMHNVISYLFTIVDSVYLLLWTMLQYLIRWKVQRISSYTNASTAEQGCLGILSQLQKFLFLDFPIKICKLIVLGFPFCGSIEFNRLTKILRLYDQMLGILRQRAGSSAVLPAAHGHRIQPFLYMHLLLYIYQPQLCILTVLFYGGEGGGLKSVVMTKNKALALLQPIPIHSKINIIGGPYFHEKVPNIFRGWEPQGP